LTAAVWNLLWALEFTITKPDMVDVPWNPIKQIFDDMAANARYCNVHDSQKDAETKVMFT